MPACEVLAGFVPRILVEVGTGSTVTWVGLSSTPSTLAEIVFASGVVELKVKAAVPSAPVTFEGGSMVLSLPEAWRVTVRPPSRLPPASRTVTVIVLVLPAVIVDGEATILDCAALGGAATRVIVEEVTEVKPLAVNRSVLVPGSPLMTRSVKLARPSPSVATVPVPPRDPPP